MQIKLSLETSQTNEAKHIIQAVITPSLPHAMLRACWYVTGGVSSCLSLFRDFPAECWTSAGGVFHAMRRIIAAETGACNIAFYLWRDQSTTQLFQVDLVTLSFLITSSLGSSLSS